MQNPHSSKSPAPGISYSSTSNEEQTFIPLDGPKSSWKNISFIAPNFEDEELETKGDLYIDIAKESNEEKPPLRLLFPDLEEERVLLTSTMSTTHLTRLLVGKKADFSLLKPLRKLHEIKKRLPTLLETKAEHDTE